MKRPCSALLSCLVLGLAAAACSKVADPPVNPEVAKFDACIHRCIKPASGECPADHEWCVVACRTGRDSTTRVMPHTSGDPVAPIEGRARLTHTIAVETLGGAASPMIRRCVDLPFEFAEIFSTSEENQASIEVHLVAGESPRADDNQTLGRFTFLGVRPAPAAKPRVQVRFRAEKSGRLTVTARDLDTGQDLTVTHAGSPPAKPATP